MLDTPGSGARVLLTDDEPRLLESLHGLLSLYDYRVDTALGGRQAMEMLRHNHYDLLLLDLRMPEVSGHDVMAFMQEHDIHTMTIVVSGETSVDDISRALKAGAYDYLKKPYVPEELLATVNNAVRRKRLEDSHRQMQGRLKRSERLHRLIVNNSPDLIYVLDEDGRFSFLNSKVETLLGYQREELIGTHITELMATEDREKGRYFFEQACRGHRDARSLDIALCPRDPSSIRRHFELAIWSVDGEEAADGQGRYRVYGTARDITDRMEAEAFINFQAYHDLLTRLPNRSLFKDRLSMAITQAGRNGKGLAVMFIDLDRFKVINDSLGHTMGDRLLQAVAQRLQGCIRKGDTLSRFGGDEFMLLLPDASSKEAAAQVADKILESIATPFELGGHDIYVGASIGIAQYPDAGTTLEALIKNADIAMYRVKNTGKDGYQFFNHDMGSTTQRLQLEQDMRRALEQGEFTLLYQSQIDAENQRMVGVEALVRWDHPEHGRLSPAEFIPIAEDSRLIIELDTATLRRAVREVHQHMQKRRTPLRLSVNLSPLLVEKEQFVTLVLDILEESGFPPQLLELEITEGLLMSDRQDVIDKLQRLSAAGVQIALDDFGTGYSSLGYLQKFPIDTLKIDRSFVHNIRASDEDACIVNAIVAMARGLRLNIVAEGVENQTQLDYLRALGCQVLQGFLFGQPTHLEILAEQFPTHATEATALPLC